MAKLSRIAIIVASLAVAGPAVAQQGTPAPQPAAGWIGAHASEAGAQRADTGTALKFTPAEIRQIQDKIRQVQRALSKEGYAVGEVDGIGGRRTIHALKEFQRHHGMRPTGEIDDRILTALGVSSIGVGNEHREMSPPTRGVGAHEAASHS